MQEVRSHYLATSQEWILTALPALLVAVMTAVLTPLALAAAAVPRWLVRAAWGAGALAALGLLALREPGPWAILASLPYALVAVAAGLIGLARLPTRSASASQITVAIGLIFVPAATTWLLAFRGGYQLLGYSSFWVLLTSAHFHVAGCYLLIIVGRAAHNRGRCATAVAATCAAAVPLTAAGIYGPHWLEVSAALVMAGAALGAGLLLLSTPRHTARRRWSQSAGAILLLTMPLAAAFALREHGTAVTWLGLDPLSSMMIAHGTPNALGFAFAALVALSPGFGRDNSPAV